MNSLVEEAEDDHDGRVECEPRSPGHPQLCKTACMETAARIRDETHDSTRCNVADSEPMPEAQLQSQQSTPPLTQRADSRTNLGPLADQSPPGAELRGAISRFDLSLQARSDFFPARARGGIPHKILEFPVKQR